MDGQICDIKKAKINYILRDILKLEREEVKLINNKKKLNLYLLVVSANKYLSKILRHIVKKNKFKVKRSGKTFFVSGNANYFVYWKNRFWEINTHRVFDKFLDLDHSYIDIGAFIGPTVLYGAHLAKKVYAIEPDPIAFKELEKNISMNPRLQNKIELHQKCVNNQSKKVKFGSKSAGGDSMSSLLFAESKTTWEVEGVTFDDFISKNNIKDCNFIKIDIEGGETLIIPSMKDYLKENKPVIYLSMHPVFFNNPEEDTKKIIDVLKIYKNIYTNMGKKIELNDLLSKNRLNKLYEIVITDKNWI